VYSTPLAKKDLEICHLDSGLMEAFADSKVEQNECMARGGSVCRFKLKIKRRSVVVVATSSDSYPI
jgi:predicted hydrocarbon binding protein